MTCYYQNYREVNLLVVHCTATRCNKDFPVSTLRASHKARGFADIGYHFYITRDGETHPCRPVHQIGAHATGWNDIPYFVQNFLLALLAYMESAATCQGHSQNCQGNA